MYLTISPYISLYLQATSRRCGPCGRPMVTVTIHPNPNPNPNPHPNQVRGPVVEPKTNGGVPQLPTREEYAALKLTLALALTQPEPHPNPNLNPTELELEPEPHPNPNLTRTRT